MQTNLSAIFTDLIALCSELESIGVQSFQYDIVSQGYVAATTDRLQRDGAMVIQDDGGVRLNPSLARASAAEKIAQIKNLGFIRVEFETYVWTNRMAVVRLIRCIEVAHREANWLLVLLLARTLVEHCADICATMRRLSKLEAPQSYEQALKVQEEAGELLAKALYATRVDWVRIITDLKRGRATGLDKKKVEYRPDESRINLLASTIMKAVDVLDKNVPGVRSVYEILCEFAHPNVGVLFCMTEEIRSYRDKDGVPHVVRRVGFDEPVGFLRELQELLLFVFGTVLEVLRWRVLVEREVCGVDETLGQAVRTLVRRVLASGVMSLDVYSPCPCASGEKLKFCCAAR